MVVESHIDRVGIKQVGLDIVDKCRGRDALQAVDLYGAPAVAAVFSNLKQPVIGPHVDEAFDLGRLRYRSDRIVVRHGDEIPGRIPALQTPHDRQIHALLVSGQVTGNRKPLIATIVRTPQALGGEVEPGGVVRAYQDRRVPIEAFHLFTCLRLGLDEDHLTGGYIDARQAPLLPMGVDNIGISGLGRGLVAIPVQYHPPVRILDTVNVVGPGGSALRAVVLGTAIDVVERLVVVNGDLVELRYRKVLNPAPVLGLVEAFVNAAVITHHDVVWIAVLESQCVAVTVTVLAIHPAESLAAVQRNLEIDIHQVDAVKLVWRCIEFLVVLRTGTAGNRVGALLP